MENEQKNMSGSNNSSGNEMTQQAINTARQQAAARMMELVSQNIATAYRLSAIGAASMQHGKIKPGS